MKPRTKQQVYIYNYAQNYLPKLDDKLQPWAFETVITHLGYRTKKHGIACLSCGHVFKGHKTANEDNCPGCGRKLQVKTTRERLSEQMAYFAVLDVLDNFQIVRYFQIRTYHKSGEAPRIFCFEVIQQYLNFKTGKHEIIARNRGGMGHYLSENFHGYLEIRDRNYLARKFNVYPDAIYPQYKVLPIFERNGFDGDVGDSNVFSVFKAILSDSKAETLLKAKQWGLLYQYLNGDKSNLVYRFWNSIKICIRNNYTLRWKEAGFWLDYLEMLVSYKKDILNAHFICPADIKAEHDKLTAKRNAEAAHKRLWEDYLRLCEYCEEDADQKLYKKPVALQLAYDRLKAHKEANKDALAAKKLDRDAQKYLQTHAHFFGLSFQSGKISISPLKSVDEFLKEGQELKHCVFANGYYKKANSLCLSAQVNGERMETVEISLKTLEVVQCYGKNNGFSPYHERILKLVNRNLPKIREAYKKSENTQTVAA